MPTTPRLLYQNLKIFNMKQPELGKKIADLRQDQGLTQEELVEKCNINVRTIQRIEAGEVQPRSYTLKTILSALSSDLSEWEEEASDLVQMGDKKMIANHLQLAMVGAVVYFLIGFPESFFEYMRAIGEEDFVSPLIYAFVKTLAVGSFALLMSGFWRIGKLYQESLLQYAALIFGCIAILFSIADVINYSVGYIEAVGWVAAQVIGYAVAGSFFGATLFLIKKHVGDIALLAGGLELSVAFCLITFILSPLGLILSIPAAMVELIILYKVRKRVLEVSM
ncbi:MAG: transcriptional regulator with XRE-family HTH domain [Cyclobacteriaceae bacterium]|jgi:transcriptional regulator with XRE-family HTH domain